MTGSGSLPTSGTVPAGTPEDVVFSVDNKNRVHVQSGRSEVKIVEDIFHELRAHVFLSNMGRDPAKGLHGAPGVNAAAKAAEQDARRNYRQSSGVPRKR